MKRIFRDADNASRCKYNIKLRDGSGAQCGRKNTGNSRYCKQHEKILAAKSAA